jgi:TnpA family transposase
LRRFRRLLGDLPGLADDETLGAVELRARLRGLITPFEPERHATQVAAIRQELGRKSQVLARLLTLARAAPLAIPAVHKLATAFATLDSLAASPNALPATAPQPFGPSWQGLIDQPDRAAALGCFRAATLMALKRALRNRSISVDHSLWYRAPEDKLIPLKLWQRDQGRFIRDLNLPASSEKYLQRLEAGLMAGLAALAEAVEAGAGAIDGDELRLPRRKPGPKDPRLEPARQALARALGDVQFPEVLIEIDGLTRFSWILLGRPPRSEQELVTLYAALMGLGSDLSAAELVRMVLRFMREHRVATLWGRGLFASADMMSLEATRYLWSARIDPRRRTFAVGTYAHVLDQWGIFYDQTNRPEPPTSRRRHRGRLAPAPGRADRARRGRHARLHAFRDGARQACRVRSVPAAGGIETRRLYLPKGLEVPHVLRPIVAETVSRRAVGRGWEGLLRLGASVKHGWDSASSALDRFGSAAAGDPIYNAGDALGRLLRSLYLCDYLSNPMFRTEVLDLLNQGEAVHSLQRAIHNGMITAKQGRTTEELGTISGALTLLANIVMAWNTHHLQVMLDRAPGDHPDEVVSRLAPIGHKHINMRGILTFDLARYRSSLLRQPLSGAEDRVSS